MCRQHRVALGLGWVAGGLVLLWVYLTGAGGWLAVTAPALTGFTVALGATRWPFVEER